MDTDYRLHLIFLLALTAIPYNFCQGQQSLEKPSCNCVNYNNEYMNCSCCPPDVSTDYVYSILYSWSGFSSMKTCDEKWSSDQHIRCNCLFCGTIHDTSHTEYAVCKDTPLEPRPFSINRSYYLSVTVYKKGQNASANFTFNPASVLKPAPVDILDHSSVITPKGSAIITLSWNAHPYFKEDLIYLVSWKRHGEDLSKNVTTENETITLVDNIEPNSLYDIEVRCRHFQEGYWSDAQFISVQTAEKCYEKAPSVLVNYKLDYSNCRKYSNDACVQLVLFWKHHYPDNGWAECTKYWLQIRGKKETLTQNVACNNVMVEVEEPLPRGRTYNVSLFTHSNSCVSPPSSLIIETVQPATGQGLGAYYTKIVRRNSTLTFSMQWLNGSTPPAKYGLFYCKEGTDLKCQGGINEVTIPSQPGNTTNFQMADPGSDFVFNVFPYKQARKSALSPQWLCATELCGRLYEPQISTIEVGQQGFTLKVIVAQDQHCLSNRNRALPVLYNVNVTSASLDRKVFSEVVNGSAPFIKKISGLYSNSKYKIDIRSEGSCGQVQHVSGLVSTSSKDHKANVLALIFGVILTVSTLLGCAGFFWWCAKHSKKKKTLLEKQRARLKALTSVSATTIDDYTQRWLDNLPISEQPEGVECEGVDNNYEEIDDNERNMDVQGHKLNYDIVKPQQSEKKCPEFFDKWRKKWNNVILCTSKPSPKSEGGERCDHSQRSPLTDPDCTGDARDLDKAETDLTETELLSINKPATPPGEGDHLLASTSDKLTNESQKKAPSQDSGAVVERSDEMHSSETPGGTRSGTSGLGEPKRNFDNTGPEVDSIISPTVPSVDRPAGDTVSSNENAMPSHEPLAQNSSSQSPDAGDDYRKMPSQSKSDEETDDDSYSESDDLESSADTFQPVIIR